MNFYQDFVHKLIKNYIIGAVSSVIGLVGVFYFASINFNAKETLYLIFALYISVLIMLAIELRIFTRELSPIRSIFISNEWTLSEIQKAYNQALEFPLLSLKRLLVPHLFGFLVPAVSITFFLIYTQRVNMPYRYLILGIVGALIITGIHALIDFFHTSRATQSILKEFSRRALERFSHDITHNGDMTTSLKRKFQLCALYIGCTPMLLFILSSQIHINTKSSIDLYNFFLWTFLILLISISFSLYGSYLLYKDISVPLNEIKSAMKNIQDGKYQKCDNVYSDEFSDIVYGFNTMVDTIYQRDMLNNQLLESFYQTFAVTLDQRDPYTAGHSVRVAKYAMKIGSKYGVKECDLSLLQKAALLHDIGKIGIRDNILLKEDKLTESEYNEIKTHPEVGALILSKVRPKELLSNLIDGVKYHHERYDGYGYPSGLSGENIPLFGRILAVADSFDAMISDRPYRTGVSVEKALSILKEGKGTQWDPKIVDIFTNIILEDKEVYNIINLQKNNERKVKLTVIK
jgi:putative nucleotidyltransferase with HDIG domain